MNFRRWITAMAVMSLFLGIASAQVIIGPIGPPVGPLSCQANVSVPPQLRSEGLTELIGDIVLSCTGGNALGTGSAIPTTNITVSLGTNVTSRLLGFGGVANASEATLLIDEPNTSTAIPGSGPAAGFTPCATPNVGAGAGGCAQVVAVGGPVGQMATAVGGGLAANQYQGLVSANQVTFLGVPVMPPASSGVARVFRITNIRANASALGAGPLQGTTQLLASISISGSASLPLTNPVQVAGFIQTGLTGSLRNSANSGGASNISLPQCGGGGVAPLATVRFTELFATAFKTRVTPTASYTGQSSQPTEQNVPGSIFPNSESGLFLQNVGAGLADYGSRLKATFNNVPSGVRLFVSTANVTNGFQQPRANPTPPNTATTSFGQLVVSETAPDTNGQLPLASPNATYNPSGSVTINIVEVSIVNGTGTATWEVANANPNALDFLDFAVYQQFTGNPSANQPAIQTATVNLSYAPTPGPSTFSAAAGAAASSSLTIPRFVDQSQAINLFSITLCRTTLLFPYVVNVSGFDTGLAIANTTSDPFGTRQQNGTCRLHFFGTAAPTGGFVDTPSIATGTVFAGIASTSAPGFAGYVIAVCNFSLAHGFAFVSDIGAREFAAGYLALVLNTGTGNRNQGNLEELPGNTIEALNQ